MLPRRLDEPSKVPVQDWYKGTQTQEVVRLAVEEVLDKNFPDSYDRKVFKEKCDNLFELMIDYATSERKWAT